MNITPSELLQLLGAKEAELYLLRKQVEILTQELAKAKGDQSTDTTPSK